MGKLDCGAIVFCALAAQEQREADEACKPAKRAAGKPTKRMAGKD